MSDRASTEVCVVVPTRGRAQALERCLRALGRQTVACEVIVVDDAPGGDPATETLAERAGVRLFQGAGRGPAAARNTGAGETRASVICFTDDDCEPEPTWAALLAERIGAGAPAAAGATASPPGAGAGVRASQAITNYLLLSTFDSDTGRLAFAPSCNLACAAQTLGAIPFDATFPLAAGEDREWSARAAAAELWPVYEPRARVVHSPRLGAAGFARQQLRYGRGAAAPAFRRRDGAADGRSFYTGLIRAGFREGAAEGALVLAAQGLTAAGIAAERLRR